jgi:hypothetical protein
MVNNSAIWVAILALALVTSVYTANFASAQTNLYTVNHEWVQIFINQDGTIDLSYNISITVTQGTLHAFDVGQPNRDFTIGEAVDEYGNLLYTYKYTPDVASVDFETPLNVGDTVWYTITTNVADMIYNDTMNLGNLGMQFIPQWISDTPIYDVRVQIVLPPDVTVQDVKTTQNFYNSTSTVEGKLAVYWQLGDINANQQVKLGVSFPSSAMPNYVPSSTPSSDDFGVDTEEAISLIIFATVFVIFVVIFVSVLRSSLKASYARPKVSMETLGIKRGLTAVEASYLLNMEPPQIVTEILYSLFKKRAVWATETKPSLKLQVLSPYENKKGTKDNPLRYYEIDLLHAIKADGRLDEEKLAKAVMFLRDTTEQKMEGFSHKDTTAYYRRIVAEAWGEVEKAGTPELASNAYDEKLLWLMLDPSQRTRTETVFLNRPFQPQPIWFWWWYGYTIYHPHPIYSPNITIPAQSPTPQAIPGAEFANNIATAVEGTANNIVVNLEKFANSILPPPPKTSHQPAPHKEGCVCACASCACACACVSCACACAGGGGR